MTENKAFKKAIRAAAEANGTSYTRTRRFMLAKESGTEPDITQLVEQAKAQLRLQVQQEYDHGRVAALKRIPDLPWHHLEEIATRHSGDVEAWIRFHRKNAEFFLVQQAEEAANPDQPQTLANARTFDFVWKLAEDLGEFAAPINFDHISYRRSDRWVRGYCDAIRGLLDDILQLQDLPTGPDTI
ncbi:hypothetical protein [Nocardia sp. NPDC056100]|uniref:hypothetical protein n=1 Tax=Nocardia sp. NPDC056100 TaxID=3345712 RepID=UPI0035DED7EC